ncbi:hypothetical protein GQ53DRAFT_785366 [Thozetella sp. PMI_491]|nr:hypothetical protein GQ53DRAFT_785366 [Thozetella sp. PMI_491]
MMSSLTTKLAMKKLGIPSNMFDFSSPAAEAPKPQKLDKNAPPGSVPGLDGDEPEGKKWPAWMTVKSLPLTVQPWLAPPPPPIPIAEAPKVGDLAPLDRDRQLTFGGGKKVIVVFLRCVGCAFAQKTFIALRTLANKHANTLTCIAVSHSSPAATQKWLDLLGGAWNVQIVIDEDRAVYAAWGLGLGSVWYVFNPTSQIAGFKDKGWLGNSVATAIQRTGSIGKGQPAPNPKAARTNTIPNGAGVVGGEEGPATVMGNKWQQAGAWAIDGRGTIVWGGKALRADDVMDMDAAAAALGL